MSKEHKQSESVKAELVNPNEFAALKKADESQRTIEVATSRAAQEVQAQMVVAKRYPRDEAVAYEKIMRACKRRRLAEQAMYAYPKGGTMITGASIRLAEEMARDWGDLDVGIIEMEQKRGRSDVMAYCWDLETNVRQTKVFTVPHKRFTKKGSYPLTDPREIYEMTANQGARRLRACILGVVPGDIVESAVEACERTLADGSSEPIQDRVRAMVAAFAEFNVKKDMVEKRLGHSIDAITETELVNLRKVYTSIKDNMAGVRDFFPLDESQADDKSTTDKLVEKVKAAKG